MRLGIIGLDGYCPRDEINCNVVFSHLMGDHTKQIQGDRPTRVGLQYLLINGLSPEVGDPQCGAARRELWIAGWLASVARWSAPVAQGKGLPIVQTLHSWLLSWLFSAGGAFLPYSFLRTLPHKFRSERNINECLGN